MKGDSKRKKTRKHTTLQFSKQPLHQPKLLRIILDTIQILSKHNIMLRLKAKDLRERKKLAIITINGQRLMHVNQHFNQPTLVNILRILTTTQPGKLNGQTENLATTIWRSIGILLITTMVVIYVQEGRGLTALDENQVNIAHTTKMENNDQDHLLITQTKAHTMKRDT